MTYRAATFWTLALLGWAALTAMPAQAGGRYSDGARHGGYHYDGGRGYRHNRRQRYRDARRHSYRYNNRYHYRQRSRSNRGAYLAGGILLGSVITHALTRPRHERHGDSYHETRVIRETANQSSAPTRRLFRDRDGNCFERATDQQGNEVLIGLPDSECAW
ncbi:MAG: hypothetical protein AB8B93_03085 [Pseudomonadales bacterium]